MFFVVNKDKIISCLIAIGTVVMLFLLVSTMKPADLNVVETSGTVNKVLPIYSVETTEPKVALTINCAW